MQTRSSDVYDWSRAVEYHHGAFPPRQLDLEKLIDPLLAAASSIARYDQTLESMRNSEILLAPLKRQEAVISSRMEGTISTLDEILRIEADAEQDEKEAWRTARSEGIETFLYARAMQRAQASLEDGGEISTWLIRSAHQVLLSFGRGADKNPGAYKNEQNYIADRTRQRILFVPIGPERIDAAMDDLVDYVRSGGHQPLLRTALAHVEFEALHPFEDGNGRIGRMLITLMLWKYGFISQPHFYVSSFFERNKEEYIERMRQVSATGAWTEWAVFFLTALDAQANANIEIASKIFALYENMKEQFRTILNSPWSISAVDFMFEQPVFRNNQFTNRSDVPRDVAHRFTRRLNEAGLLVQLEASSGRRPALYSFEPLLALVRNA